METAVRDKLAGTGEYDDQKVNGSIPGTYSPHAQVSLGNTLNPKLPLKAVPAAMICDRICTKYEYVDEGDL